MAPVYQRVLPGSPNPMIVPFHHHNPIDIHLLAAFKASAAALMVANVLPDSDLNEELRSLLQGQFDILNNHLHGKHYGTDHLESYILYADELQKEVARIQNNNPHTRGE